MRPRKRPASRTTAASALRGTPRRDRPRSSPPDRRDKTGWPWRRPAASSYELSLQFRDALPQRDERALGVAHRAQAGGGDTEELLGAAATLRRRTAEPGCHQALLLHAAAGRIDPAEPHRPSSRPLRFPP